MNTSIPNINTEKNRFNVCVETNKLKFVEININLYLKLDQKQIWMNNFMMIVFSFYQFIYAEQKEE